MTQSMFQIYSTGNCVASGNAACNIVSDGVPAFARRSGRRFPGLGLLRFVVFVITLLFACSRSALLSCLFLSVPLKLLMQALGLTICKMLGDQAHFANVGSISGAEMLVRASVNDLRANFGQFSSPGSPDMNRLGSTVSCPSDNNGGGIGTWHDANLCSGIPSGSESELPIKCHIEFEDFECCL
jgi:hypothetical protein